MKSAVSKAACRTKAVTPTVSNRITVGSSVSFMMSPQQVAEAKKHLEEKRGKYEIESNSSTPRTRPDESRKPTGNRSAARKPTRNPAVARKPNGNPAGARKSTGNPALTRKHTGNPAVIRKPTGNPAVARKPTGNLM